MTTISGQAPGLNGHGATISGQALHLAGPATISGQVLDLAEVPVRPFQRTVQTRSGPRVEVVRGHLENDTRPAGWIPQEKWLEGQQEWKTKGEAAREAGAARDAAADKAAALPWTQDGDILHFNGSLGIDRAGMPQLSGILPGGRYAPSSEMMPKFIDQLKSKGRNVTRERVPASSLHPTQTTGDARAVRGLAKSLAAGEVKDTKPVLVSSDDRVIDGHHQWAAHLLGDAQGTRTGTEPGTPVIRVHQPASVLLEEARRFARDQGIASRALGVAADPRFTHKPVTAPRHSLEKHTRPDGTLTPERAALHQRIIDGLLAGHEPQEHPVATFFGGGPAAGKSTALRATPADTVHVDSDEIKAQLPEYQQMLEAKDPRAAAFVHWESSEITKKAVEQAQARRLNFTWDGTGDSNIGKLAAKVHAARRNGYLTEGKYVTTGTDEAVKRAQARAAQTGRHVPETFIRETHAGVSDTYPKAVKTGLFDATELWDTTSQPPKLVASKAPGGAFTIHDRAAWNSFRDKAKEGRP